MGLVFSFGVFYIFFFFTRVCFVFGLEVDGGGRMKLMSKLEVLIFDRSWFGGGGCLLRCLIVRGRVLRFDFCVVSLFSL